jgi:hypothetical protein
MVDYAAQNSLAGLEEAWPAAHPATGPHTAGGGKAYDVQCADSQIPLCDDDSGRPEH